MHPIRIAVDIEGGDNSPDAHIQGAVDALGMDPELLLTLVCTDEHRKLVDLARHRASSDIADRINVHTARQVMPQGEVKDTKQTTMYAAASLVRTEKDERRAAAVLTSGNTAALVAVASHSFGRFRNILAQASQKPSKAMPALMTPIPSEKGHSVILIDAGANPDTTPEQLVLNARWGNICARCIHDVREPMIRLLSNGQERGKGSHIVHEAHELLAKQTDVHVRGNAEPKHVLLGEIEGEDIHVVAADGFSANIFLKTLSAGIKTILQRTKMHLRRGSRMSPLHILRLLSGLGMRSTLRDTVGELRAKVGSGMIVGVKGLAFKVHGASEAEDVYDGIRHARRLIETSLLKELRTLHEEES